MCAEHGFVPIVCSVAADCEGNPLNVNADSAAAALAGALGAAKLVLLTDTDGVYGDADKPETLISRLSPAQAREMVRPGRASRGMIPKLEAAMQALEEGVPSVHLINGARANALLIEIFTDQGVGTMLAEAPGA